MLRLNILLISTALVTTCLAGASVCVMGVVMSVSCQGEVNPQGLTLWKLWVWVDNTYYITLQTPEGFSSDQRDEITEKTEKQQDRIWLTGWRVTDKRDCLAGGELIGHFYLSETGLAIAQTPKHLSQQYWLDTSFGNSACRQPWNRKQFWQNTHSSILDSLDSFYILYIKWLLIRIFD